MSQPTTHMVAQIIVEQMMHWKADADADQRRDELYAMADRLIRYFMFFDPLPATLPGLPGGQPYAPEG